MRRITTHEVAEYLNYAYQNLSAREAGFTEQQGQAIMDAVAECLPLMDAITKKIRQGLAEGYNPEDLVMSMWIMAFQMGREFESLQKKP